jgi:signal peptidase I
MIATALLLLVLIGVTIAALVITRQPPVQPLQVPSASSA